MSGGSLGIQQHLCISLFCVKISETICAYPKVSIHHAIAEVKHCNTIAICIFYFPLCHHSFTLSKQEVTCKYKLIHTKLSYIV